MPLHPQIKGFLDMLRAANLPPYEQSTPAEARARMDMIGMLESPAEPVAEVRDLTVAGPQGELPLRLYYPRSLKQGGLQPALVYFHGGGWVIGSITSHDGLCRALANAAACIVISVGYRLAPEHKFPAAVIDCEAGFRYIATHAAELGIAPDRIAVGGDSAGGNLAAVVAVRARDSGGVQPIAQLLIYPATGHGIETASRARFAEGHLLTRGTMRWFADHYLRDANDAYRPEASPRLVEDLSGLPSAYVLTAEYDPLCDEGEEYARLLHDAAVPVTLRRFGGMIHGFVQLTGIAPITRCAIDEVASWLRTTLGSAVSKSVRSTPSAT